MGSLLWEVIFAHLDKCLTEKDGNIKESKNEKGWERETERQNINCVIGAHECSCAHLSSVLGLSHKPIHSLLCLSLFELDSYHM